MLRGLKVECGYLGSKGTYVGIWALRAPKEARYPHPANFVRCRAISGWGGGGWGLGGGVLIYDGCRRYGCWPPPARGCITVLTLQGYLAHKKQRPARTLQYGYT